MRINAIGVGPSQVRAQDAVMEHSRLNHATKDFGGFAGFTIFETHDFMCGSFNLNGMGLGPQKGQRLVIGA